MAKQINATKNSGLAFYYDEEIFNDIYTSEPDPTSLVLLESGAMVEDSVIARLISNGSNYYALPYYKDIDGDELNYDGTTDLTVEDTDSGIMHGVVWGRMKGWRAVDFVSDFSTADPIRNILNRIQKWKSKKQQKRLIGILDAVLSIASDDDLELHTTDIASTVANTVTDDNKIGLTTARDCVVKANGDKADDYALAIMHSQVANRLSQFNVLEYFKYNLPNGQEADVRVGKTGNMIVLVCDEVPHSVDGTSKAMEYTTYFLGRGVVGHATAPVEHPTEMARDPEKLGGIEKLYTRYRETMHPYGFSFEMSSLPISPTDAQLHDKANWKRKYDAKNIYISRLISNG